MEKCWRFETPDRKLAQAGLARRGPFAVVAQEVRSVGPKVEDHPAPEVWKTQFDRTNRQPGCLESREMTERSRGERMVDLVLNPSKPGIRTKILYSAPGTSAGGPPIQAVVGFAADTPKRRPKYVSPCVRIALGSVDPAAPIPWLSRTGWLCEPQTANVDGPAAPRVDPPVLRSSKGGAKRRRRWGLVFSDVAQA